MIHNPDVNNDLQQRGIKFIMDTEGKQFIPSGANYKGEALSSFLLSELLWKLKKY